ncbi:MAG: VCBS repeat-containing protein [Bacteroidota bacterium]|nr:VCBS repeat-containing protein [Bacteroidota bacterium]
MIKYSLYLLFFFLITSCKNRNFIFNKIPSSHSNIHFNNQIIENDTLNPIDVTNIYNGGGVGIGDFNNDGLQDIYFTGNKVSNKLYLNKGNLKFDDITSEAGVDGKGRWCRGVSVVDINNDGWMDMYVSASMEKDPQKRQNLLYINQGLDKNGVPVFKEMAAEYGLNDTTHSTMAAFFDYDNDGDLDMYLTVNEIVPKFNAAVFRPKFTNGSFPSTGRLYRNDWDTLLKHPVFIDVTKQAGVTVEGYGHAVSIADFNKDGWKDIFVTNDFISNDLLYINNHNGTFTNEADKYFKHTSANGMGQDVIDINNDGLSDVVELDMNPEDNYRKKMMMGPNNYQLFQFSDYYGYQYQYVRNTLQLNQGPSVNENDSIGNPVFSDIGFFSGIAQTDWSWCPLVTDFDSDGYRDIIITNGFPKDITDHDFISFRRGSSSIASIDYTLAQIPAVKLHNYAFHNNGDLTFNNATNDWGLSTPSFSNGAAYADLDNDGDMDVVVNNINDEAFVYENTSMNDAKNHPNYLAVKLQGDTMNVNGLGAWIDLYYNNGKHQAYEQTPYRGYLSTMQIEPHFGLGNISVIDSLVVKWPDGKEQVLLQVKANETILVDEKNAHNTYSFTKNVIDSNALFKEINDSVNIHYVHKQKDFIDFNIQRTIPHKFSEYGPALAVGDVDGNGLDDMLSGGALNNSAQIFLQQPDGKFIQKSLLNVKDSLQKNREDEGILLFDADGDGDLDLYIASGGYAGERNTNAYQDKLYVNDGKGNFKEDTTALPQNYTSKFCVRAIDYDKDGDLDLFVSGRVDPANYPRPVSSFIFRNDSKNGHIKFTDVTDAVAPALKNIGLVCDALFTDFDNDGWPDLILAGEWMPVTFLKNDKGIFKNVTAASGISNNIGWWNTIAAGDFDNDGDMDYIVGNLGRNSFYKASDQYPVKMLAKDFDNNGTYDAFPSVFLPASQSDTGRKEFPAQSRDDILGQMIGLRKKFADYKSFARAPMDSIFSDEQRKGALQLRANYFSSALMQNDGNGKFTIVPLPVQAQLSVLNGLIADDFDGDGNLDVLINGNDYGTEVTVGRYDAMNGLLLKGDGKGNFNPLSILQSGIYIPGNGKALVSLKSKSKKYFIAASQNRGPLKVFKLNRNKKLVEVKPFDESAIIIYKNGRKQKREVSYGSSFLSQSGRFLTVDDNVVSVTIKNNKGEERSINLQ